jgi:tetratricopeptide (TPR) repeat protein
MSASHLSPYAGTRQRLPGTGIWGSFRILGATLLALAVKSACCQVDSPRLADQVTTAQRMIVSANQLRAPKDAQKAIDRARDHFLHGRHELAQKEVQRALDICPHYGLALAFQGIIDLGSGNNVQAQNAFQRAIDDDSTLGSAYLGLGIVLNRQGRFKEATVPLGRAAPLLPAAWLLHFESAWAHFGIGEFAVGLRDARSAEGLAESDPEKLSGVAYLRGIAQLHFREFSDANSYFEEAVRHDPKGTFATLAKRRMQQIRGLTESR